MTFPPVAPDEIDTLQLTRELDRTKSAVFLGKNAAFFGSLMCSLNFLWTRGIDTAGTDGREIVWNPDYFQSLPPDSRKTDLMHELRHAAYLHMVRRGDRDHRTWNLACDIKIDLELEAEGYTFEGIQGVLTSQTLDARRFRGMVEEDIYAALQQNPPPAPPGCRQPRLDILPVANHAKQAAINAVVQAVQAAKMHGQAGTIPGGVEQMLKVFLEPVVPWETVLMQFFTDLLDEDYSWRRPNRRYADLYLPSRVADDGRLEHLTWYFDVSGSVTERQALRVASEVKYIQTVLKPQKLTLVQFDTRLTKIREYTEEDPFDDITIVGRGGTSLVPVRQHIIDTRPSAAVVFSDLLVTPMEPLPFEVPIIWIGVGNPKASVPFGKLIHVK